VAWPKHHHAEVSRRRSNTGQRQLTVGPYRFCEPGGDGVGEVAVEGVAATVVMPDGAGEAWPMASWTSSRGTPTSRTPVMNATRSDCGLICPAASSPARQGCGSSSRLWTSRPRVCPRSPSDTGDKRRSGAAPSRRLRLGAGQMVVPASVSTGDRAGYQLLRQQERQARLCPGAGSARHGRVLQGTRRIAARGHGAAQVLRLRARDHSRWISSCRSQPLLKLVIRRIQG
jgi:hypothetical protein